MPRLHGSNFCFDEACFSLFAPSLTLPGFQETEVLLHIVVVCNSSEANIICFLLFNFLSKSFFFADNNSRLLFNSIKWMKSKKMCYSTLVIRDINRKSNYD